MNIDEPIDTSLKCQYCEAVEDEDTEIITGRGGDEIGYICEGCHDRMFG